MRKKRANEEVRLIYNATPQEKLGATTISGHKKYRLKHKKSSSNSSSKHKNRPGTSEKKNKR